MEKKKILVCGAGGFIGSHIVDALKKEGHFVIGADIKYPEYDKSSADEFHQLDLTDYMGTIRLFQHYMFDEVYQMAADMGGAGYINTGCNDGQVVWNSMSINLNVVKACVFTKVKKVFYASSACVYPEHLQEHSEITGLKETDAYPAQPDSEYGWEKLFSERLYKTFQKQYGLEVRIGRFHNIFGHKGTWDGGREKAPAAMCRKVALYNLGKIKEVDIWGDGQQTRSFLFIEEALEGIFALMNSDYDEPLNIGSDFLISINDLVKMIMRFDVADPVVVKHIDGPQGVRGRNSENTLVQEVLGWKPTKPLEYGIQITYHWIKQQILENEK